MARDAAERTEGGGKRRVRSKEARRVDEELRKGKKEKSDNGGCGLRRKKARFGRCDGGICNREQTRRKAEEEQERTEARDEARTARRVCLPTGGGGEVGSRVKWKAVVVRREAVKRL